MRESADEGLACADGGAARGARESDFSTGAAMITYYLSTWRTNTNLVSCEKVVRGEWRWIRSCKCSVMLCTS